MRPHRLLAIAAATVLAGGVAIAATDGRARPQPVAAKPVARLSPSPAPAPAQATVGPTPSAHRSTPRPTMPSAHRVNAARPLFPLPAGPAYPRPCPPPPIPPGPPFKPPKPAVRAAKLPAPVALVAHRHVSLAAISGKGMWLTTWADSHVDVHAVVARAKAAGLHQLWVRTGGSLQGWYGTRLLTRLLPAAHAAGLAVIAWDFPTLSDPLRDVARAAAAIDGRFAGQRIDGFSPDLETIYEGTFNAPVRIRVYLSRVRALDPRLPLVATVMRPTPAQLATYPYAAEAPYVDAFAPMVYWSCTEPGAAAVEALRPLARLRPVHLIGQSYDMASEGGRHGLPSAREIWRFLDVAKRAGAVGASLYVYDQTRAPQWRALGAYPWAPRH